MAEKSVLQRAARRFRRDGSGNFGMMLAVLAPMLLVGAGFGINIAQVSSARSNLLAALDSAVTSTARDLTTGVIEEKDAKTSLEVFLYANGVRSFSKRDKLTLDSVVLDRHRKTVIAHASVVVDVAFPLFGAANTQKITTVSAARYSDRKIEVVMMLDVTGSMKPTKEEKNRRGEVTKEATDKIGDLMTAATIAVEALLSGNEHSPGRIRVALVPYAASVNAGALAEKTVFIEEKDGPNLPPAGWTPPASRPDNCATERKLANGNADLTDDAPDSQRWNNTTKEYYTALVHRDERLDDEKTTKCPASAIVPLTTDEDTLKSVIGSFTADGNTGGGIATQWAYYMLSPKWRDVISETGLGDGPADHDPEKIGKVAILMTDGVYNRVYAGSNSSTNARNVCTRMKNDGIEIFTIGFAVTNATARTTLSNCASPDTALTKHFYEAATGEELKRAFQDIVRNIERLALIQ